MTRLFPLRSPGLPAARRWEPAAVKTLLGLCTLPLAGCEMVQSTFHTAGPAAAHIATLAWFEVILFLIITAVMWALIGYAFYRRRGSLDTHEPITSAGGEMWIAIGGLGIPLIVLTVLFVWGLELLSAFPIHGMRGGMSPAQVKETMKPQILVIGHQWWWEIHYLDDDPSKGFITANELHLPVGQAVNIEVETHDVMHSFWIPALHGKVDMIPSQVNYIRLEASKPGEYSGQCAEFCGDEHARMRLLAIAQEPAQYQAWKAAQLKPGAQPTTPDAQEGEKIFVGSPCALCHTVRGTLAGGSVAPDLTHIGSRKMIASDVYPNTNAYLEAWITHAQSLKPDCLMPNLTQFTGPQLQDLVAYLRQLQ